MTTGRRFLAAAALLLPLMAACGSGDGQDPALPAAEPGTTVTVDLDERPFKLHFPRSYDPAAATPLVVLLHGYSSSAVGQEAYFQLAPESDRRNFLYAMPDGTIDPDGQRFWNATDACCDFGGTDVDDSAYLRRLIDTLTSGYQVDAVYLVGHSNGGFMAHRMACEHAEVLTAVVSFAGAATDDPSECTPGRPVSVLQIHGTDDQVIPFDGGANFGNPFPSAEATVSMWRERNGCAAEGESGELLDLDAIQAGAETTVTGYRAGCGGGSVVALWSINGGNHSPRLTADFAPAVIDFLYARAPR